MLIVVLERIWQFWAAFENILRSVKYLWVQIVLPDFASNTTAEFIYIFLICNIFTRQLHNLKFSKFIWPIHHQRYKFQSDADFIYK